MKYKYFAYLLIVLFTVALFSNCGKSKRKVVFDTKPVSIKTFDTPPGADPTVPAELGGAGFTGEGWETKTDYSLLGDVNAVKGGSLIMSMPDFPGTLRTEGKDANSYFNRMAQNMIYEPLLQLDPVTDDYMPALATHWKISDDKMKFTFRIDPNARWADGKPVVAEDVIATWKLLVDPGILEAYSNILYGTYEQPVAESKYIVSVKSKQLNWRQLLYFGVSMRIMPAHYIGNISGKEYLEKYQFEFIPGSGPYLIDKNDINKGQSIMIRRRSDYWAEKERYNTGLYNFDLVRFEVIADQSLEFEKFKKGEIDVINVNRAQWWIERFDFDEYNRGLVLKRRIFNENPNGVSGICFNMRKPPFDDIRIRQAFAHLYDREKFNEKLFYNMYYPTYSFFAGSVYENPNNPKIKFDIDKAQQLLAEAGWKEKNKDGYLVKDGKVFEYELPFYGFGQDRYLTVYQEDLKKVGIKLNLRQIDGTTNFKLGNERNFSIITMSWSGLQVPNPESSMGPGTADEPNTTNWPGIKDPRIDELCKKYNESFDRAERIKIIREIDFIAVSMQPYAFGWYGPYQRIAFHNKFGYPEWMLPRKEDYLWIPIVWYNDPVKAAEYEDAKKNTALQLEKGEVDQKFWVNVKEREEKGEKVTLGQK
jgi:microcin C transport system substrate-binding protein